MSGFSRPAAEKMSTTPSDGNCSDLRGNEQPSAFQEGVQAPGPPGSEEECQGHFAVAALFRASPAADFPADYQVAQAPFGGIIVRWSLRARYEDEQFPVSSTGQAFDMTLNSPAELGLHRQWVFQERTAQRQQPLFRRQLPPGWGPSRSMSPPGQYCVFRVQRLQRVNVPQQSLPPTPIGGWPNISV